MCSEIGRDVGYDCSASRTVTFASVHDPDDCSPRPSFCATFNVERRYGLHRAATFVAGVSLLGRLSQDFVISLILLAMVDYLPYSHYNLLGVAVPFQLFVRLARPVLASLLGILSVGL